MSALSGEQLPHQNRLLKADVYMEEVSRRFVFPEQTANTKRLLFKDVSKRLRSLTQEIEQDDWKYPKTPQTSMLFDN
jgi:hypothetical protein